MKNLILSFLALLCAGCAQQKDGQLVLFDPAQDDAGRISTATGDRITRSEGTIQVIFAPAVHYPVIEIHPAQGIWDASAWRFIRCEMENMNDKSQLVELGTGDYDLTLGAVLLPPHGSGILTAVIYRTEHPAYIDTVFPVMHGKPGGELRGWMASTNDTIEYIKLLFPEARAGDSVRIGRMWLEDPYELLSEEELIEKYYPFVDEFGQFMYRDWPGKIHSVDDLKAGYQEEINELSGPEPMPEWDRYGGWANGPSLKATGRFRVEKFEGKWWLVDPEGKLFWSHGLDCVEFGAQSRTRISGCEAYFSYLPEKGSPEEKLVLSRDVGEGESRWLSFHALNLFRIHGAWWREVSNDLIHKRMRSWGINTIGNWSAPDIYLKRMTPYVLTAYTTKTGELADPYLPGFRENLEQYLEAEKENAIDPWCLGVFVDNELKWGVKWASKIPEEIMLAPADQPAKVVFEERMRARYHSVDKLNEVWGTSFTNWSELLTTRKVIPGAAADMRAFMHEYTARYYASCRDAVKKVAPDLLYLGCRMDFHLYPEDTTLNYIIKIASQYCDVVSFNRYRYTCSELVPPDGGDYPLIIGEFHFGSLETGLLQPGLRYAADPEERASFYEYYVKSALRNPYLVGTHWFQLADQAVTGRGDGENYQAGFLTVGDRPQKEIIEKSRKIGKEMYIIRSGQNK
jgi:hypothetical protein